MEKPLFKILKPGTKKEFYLPGYNDKEGAQGFVEYMKTLPFNRDKTFVIKQVR